MNNNNGKVFLTADAIFRAPLKTEIVEAFGGKVMVQELLECRAAAIAEETAAESDAARGMRILVACVVDPETREPIFTEADIEKLKKLSNAEVAKVVKAVNRVNGWAPAEDILKNSEASPNDVSVTA